VGGSFDGDLGEGGWYFGIFRSEGVVEGVFKEKRRELKVRVSSVSRRLVAPKGRAIVIEPDSDSIFVVIIPGLCDLGTIFPSFQVFSCGAL
jgi:hypothetical protein